jgi:uncharacterized membrane protein YbhN (UPF0104 family)
MVEDATRRHYPRAVRSWRKILAAAFFAVAIALLVVSVWSNREALGEALTRLSVGAVVLSTLAACAALVAQMLSWRALLAGTGEVPSLLGSARIFYHGQLGKYVPGSVWTVVAQAELGRRHGVSRARSAVVALGSMAVMVVVGGAFAVLALAVGSPGSLAEYWWAVAIVPIGAIGLSPPVFNRVVARLLVLLRRGDTAVRVDGRGLALASFWSLVMWVLFGVHTALLVRDLHPGGGFGDVVVASGAFALAWVVGFLVVIAPAGAGPREAALVLALGGVLTRPDALLVALVSRAALVVADAAAAAVASVRSGPRPAEPAGAGTETSAGPAS